MEVPSPAAGVVKELKVKVGDKVSEGTLISSLEAAARASAHRRGRAAAAPRKLPAPRRRPRRRSRSRRRVADARRGDATRQGRHRMRDAGAGRRARRLQRRVSRRRSRHEDGAGRALCVAGRRVPQRRLHPVEGAAAHRRGHGRSRGAGRARHRFGEPKVDLAKLRALEGQGRRQADRRPRRHGQGAQGRGRARLRPVPRSAPCRSRSHRGHRARRRPARRRSSGSQKAIIAAGSQSVRLPFVPDDPRIVDSTGALELRGDPEAHAGRSAAASSGWKWRPSIRRWARASTSSRCSTA